MSFVERPALEPHGIKDRPLDFYLAFLVTFIGLYGFLDPNWPEDLSPLEFWIITIEDVYLVTAGISVMIALILKELRKYLPFAMALEQISWLFISAASAVIALTAAWVPPTVVPLPNDQQTVAWVFLWSGLCIAASVRSFNVRKKMRRCGRV